MVIGGFTAEEMIEIMHLCGRHSSVKSIDITGYNPSMEDYRTGKFISSLVYYAIMGLALRNKIM
jgi:arginase family enzyme